MPDPNVQTYWRRTRSLTRAVLGAWAVLALAMPLLVVPLNAFSLPYVDLPLGLLMTTQGALVAFTLIVWVFARRQDRIDRDHFLDSSISEPA